MHGYSIILTFAQLDPRTVWLREEFGSRAYFPDSSNTEFVIDVDNPPFGLIVEGQPNTTMPASQNGQGVPVAVPQSSSSASAPPPFKPVFPRKSLTATVKITRATLTYGASGKAEFARLDQAFFEISEENANVPYLTNAVQQKWGQEYKIVTNDGLDIDDSSGTAGMQLITNKSSTPFSKELSPICICIRAINRS